MKAGGNRVLFFLHIVLNYLLKEGNCTVEAGKCVSVLKKPVICEKTGSMLKRSGEAGLLCTVWKCQVFSKSRGGTGYHGFI